ncbi:TPA: MbeB family mobilization protein [Neisseria gonorrhoeae]|uniref:MbeB family mobilization protein n=1 Tax=Neisseria gonorrhoeae TaxID=485 RepID=UPI000E06D512|nr:MbeB family mobilization protein [Neisseria gonorrhoeae]STZ91411.1 MbeB-like, N-term conserved region [Neisseria gonorrhoeae]STZ91421.1 MbeB-like, N-term conserved region [Neisseria gonorrhoeae]
MSKISDLAKTFEQTSRTEAASIEQQTKADLETLRKNINEALKQSEQKITADINARQLRMSKAVFKPYLWSLLGISAAGLIVIAGLFIAIWSVKNELDDLKQQRAEAERTLDLLETKTKGLTLENCPVENSKATRVCVATDPNSPPYYANKDKTRAWRYIPQKNSR